MGGAVFLSCWLFGMKWPGLEPAGSWLEPGLGVEMDMRGEGMLVNIPKTQEVSGNPAPWT